MLFKHREGLCRRTINGLKVALLDLLSVSLWYSSDCIEPVDPRGSARVNTTRLDLIIVRSAELADAAILSRPSLEIENWQEVVLVGSVVLH